MAVSLEKKQNKKAQPPKHSKLLSSYIHYASLSFQMMAIMSIAVWAGLKLDKFFQLNFPVFLILLSLGATVLTIYLLIRKLTRTLHK